MRFNICHSHMVKCTVVQLDKLSGYLIIMFLLSINHLYNQSINPDKIKHVFFILQNRFQVFIALTFTNIICINLFHNY